MKNKKSFSQKKPLIKKLPNCKIKHLPTPLRKMMSSKSLITKISPIKLTKIGDMATASTPITQVKILKIFCMTLRSPKELSEKSYLRFTKLVRI